MYVCSLLMHTLGHWLHVHTLTPALTVICSITNAITTRGKCKKHDSKTVACSVEGCGTNVQNRGLCRKHGAYGICSFTNCTTPAQARGRCCLHSGGSRKVCKMDGCNTIAVARGVCGKHGARGTCKFKGCTTNAQKKGRYCAPHGAKKLCSVAGCISYL